MTFSSILAKIVDIDKDYLVIEDLALKDSQVRAYSKSDKEDKNYEVKLLYRVECYDSDNDDDNLVKYIVVTSVLDGGDYDNLSLELVDRNFELE